MAWDAISHEILEIKSLAVLAYWGAIGFYASIPFLLIPAIRREFVRLFSPAMPVTQSMIKPLDSFRGIAALGIACFHLISWLKPYYDPVAKDLPILNHAYKSVPIFVILSGFLIYRSIRDFEALDELRHYVRRRILRIYPLYIVSVLVFFAFADVRPNPASWFQRILPEIFMMKVFGYPTYIYPSYWSLYVEELFYLSMPLWVVATRRWPLLSAYIGLALFSLIGSAVPDDVAMMKYFFFGIIACELLDTKEIKKVSQLGAAAILAVGLSLLYFEYTSGDILGQFVTVMAKRFGATLYFNTPLNPSDPFGHYYTFTLGLGFMLVLLGAIKFRPANSMLSIFPLRFLGTISYSVFVWNGFIVLYENHTFLNTMMPMVSFSDTAFPSVLNGSLVSFSGVYIPSFIFFGAVSYLLIERPFLLLRTKKLADLLPKFGSAKMSVKSAGKVRQSKGLAQ